MDRAKRTPVYTLARIVAGFLFHSVAPVRYVHREKTELAAPYIFIANHKSMMDPLIVGYPVRRYEIIFLGKQELARSRPLAWLFKKLHMITVDRGHSDMAAMRAAIRVLREGGVLGVFPEGTRHKQGLMAEREDGVSLLALRSGVPLVPAYIAPPFRLFRKTVCTFGDPIPTDDLRAQGVNRETCEALNRRITETYARMAEVQNARQ